MTKAKSKPTKPEIVKISYAPLRKMPIPASSEETIKVLTTISRFTPDELSELIYLSADGLEPHFLAEARSEGSITNLLDHLRDIHERAVGLSDPTFRFGADDMRTCRIFNSIKNKVGKIIEAEDAR
jgi:hypothetical protein